MFGVFSQLTFLASWLFGQLTFWRLTISPSILCMLFQTRYIFSSPFKNNKNSSSRDRLYNFVHYSLGNLWVLIFLAIWIFPLKPSTVLRRGIFYGCMILFLFLLGCQCLDYKSLKTWTLVERESTLQYWKTISGTEFTKLYFICYSWIGPIS